MIYNPISAYLTAWAITYIACAVVKPDYVYSIGDYIVPRRVSQLGMFLIGAIMGIAVAMPPSNIVSSLLVLLGVFESFGCVASFTHVVMWRYDTPLGHIPKNYVNNTAQIAMGILDLVAAALLFMMV